MAVEASLYDYPLYYNILFGWDRHGEAELYARLFARAGRRGGGVRRARARASAITAPPTSKKQTRS